MVNVSMERLRGRLRRCGLTVDRHQPISQLKGRELANSSHAGTGSSSQQAAGAPTKSGCAITCSGQWSWNDMERRQQGREASCERDCEADRNCMKPKRMDEVQRTRSAYEVSWQQTEMQNRQEIDSSEHERGNMQLTSLHSSQE